jgi:protein-tyrosine phosphatase
MEIVAVNPQGTLLLSGDIDDWEALRRHQVDTIVDMDGDVDAGVPEAPNEILYVYFPIFDEDLPNLRKLDALGRLVADLVEGRHIVLVHCRLGVNRSNLLVATALSYLGMTGQEALDHLRGIRPGALFNETFANHIVTLPARRLRLEVLTAPAAPEV